MIHQVGIKSLPQEWLWCETWCSDESKTNAKTIDLVSRKTLLLKKMILCTWEQEFSLNADNTSAFDNILSSATFREYLTLYFLLEKKCHKGMILINGDWIYRSLALNDVSLFFQSDWTLATF